MKTKLLCVAALAVLAAQSEATILTFDYSFSNGANVNQSYGDGVTSTSMGSFGYGVGAEGFTSNVQVTFGNSDPSTWNSGYADLVRVLYENADSSGILKVTLTADAGYNVRLYDFDLGAFQSSFSADPTVQLIDVADGSGNNLYTRANGTVSESPSTHTHLDLTTQPVVANTLVLSIDARNLGSLNDDIGLDNLRFGQETVPEPLSLIIVPLAIVALKRRFRSDLS